MLTKTKFQRDTSRSNTEPSLEHSFKNIDIKWRLETG